MAGRSIEQETNGFVRRLSGDRINSFGSIDGRTLRRAAERKRRIEAKKATKRSANY